MLTARCRPFIGQHKQHHRDIGGKPEYLRPVTQYVLVLTPGPTPYRLGEPPPAIAELVRCPSRQNHGGSSPFPWCQEMVLRLGR